MSLLWLRTSYLIRRVSLISMRLILVPSLMEVRIHWCPEKRQDNLEELQLLETDLSLLFYQRINVNHLANHQWAMSEVQLRKCTNQREEMLGRDKIKSSKYSTTVQSKTCRDKWLRTKRFYKIWSLKIISMEKAKPVTWDTECQLMHFSEHIKEA